MFARYCFTRKPLEGWDGIWTDHEPTSDSLRGVATTSVVFPPLPLYLRGDDAVVYAWSPFLPAHPHGDAGLAHELQKMGISDSDIHDLQADLSYACQKGLQRISVRTYVCMHVSALTVMCSNKCIACIIFRMSWTDHAIARSWTALFS